MTADRVLLEVCVDTPAGLAAAIAGGADRIELCAALGLQGLTPAPGLMALAAEAPIPIYPMIRPRNGDFCFDTRDLDAMRRDIDAVRRYGLAGVTIGANRPDGELDLDVLEKLVEHSAGLGMTLHRSFDFVTDQAAALEAAVALGFERVLTSGGALTAEGGAERIAALVNQANGRIRILAGSGVRTSNVADLVRRTGVREVHGSFSGPIASAAAPRLIEMGFASAEMKDTDQRTVAEMARILRSL